MLLHDLLTNNEVHFTPQRCTHCDGTGIIISKISEGFIKIDDSIIQSIASILFQKGFNLVTICPVNRFNKDEATGVFWYELKKIE